MTGTTRWGDRAAGLYTDDYADRYRAADDSLSRGDLVVHFGRWIGSICDSFGRDIDVLDVGCGTGRYFHALRHVRRLVGIDVSKPMLARAAHPIGAPSVAPELVAADFLAHEFAAGEFDLAYSIGVLAEHSPFDAAVASRVWRWLRPGGRFAFTAVHPLSFSIPRTLKRRTAEALLPLAAGSARRALRARLMRDGLYADDERLREVLAGASFAVESIEPYRSDVHLHLLVVARKA